jgi:hypothetical protein
MYEHSKFKFYMSFRLAFHQDAEGEVTLPFWGKVVDAAGLGGNPFGKNHVLPMGNSHGLELFLDGSTVMNHKRSDCCFSWFCEVEPLPESSVDAATSAADSPCASGASGSGSIVVASSLTAASPRSKGRGKSKTTVKVPPNEQTNTLVHLCSIFCFTSTDALNVC